MSLALASTPVLGGSAAQAQTPAHDYDVGTVWRVSAVEVKPGQFDAYMHYLSTTWRAAQELQKKAGNVISYKVLQVDSPRDHEPDLFLMVEYKNMAVFDQSLTEQDARTAAIFGSVAKAEEASAAREALRTGRGQVLLRELRFTQ
jgi:hypothetical protein